MIPITGYAAAAVAALIYTHAYDQDPDSGWRAGDPHSAPVPKASWREWSVKLLQVLQEQPDRSDEQLVELVKQRIDLRES